MNILDNDIVSPEVYAQPELLHARYTKYRQHAPVAWVDLPLYRPFWAVTRHADIIEIERQHSRFINEPRITIVPRVVEDQTIAAMGRRTAVVRTLLDMDDPDHRQYRNVTQSWFLGPGVASFQDRVNVICKTWVDRMQARGTACDFATEIANFVPLAVIMSILGLPESDTQYVLRSTQQIFAATDPDLQDGSNDHGQTAFADFMAYLGRLVEQRRREPTSDLASVIANGVVNGAPMALLETLSYLMVAATAGHETTASALAGGMLVMLENPAQIHKLQSDPGLWERSAAEEVVRWTTPVRHMMRTATEDYVLRGQTIRAGDSLALMYLSANRDEEVFPDPFVFDVERRNGRQIGFGFGAHFCLGRLLALSEIRTFFRELLGRVEHIELDGTPRYAQSNFVGTLKSLPIRYRFRN